MINLEAYSSRHTQPPRDPRADDDIVFGSDGITPSPMLRYPVLAPDDQEISPLHCRALFERLLFVLDGRYPAPRWLHVPALTARNSQYLRFHTHRHAGSTPPVVALRLPSD